MKFVCLSDTHGMLPDIRLIPDGDILIHCGDIMGMDSIESNIKDINKFNEWVKKLTHEIKLFVPGNHDVLFEKDFHFAKTLLNNCKVLVDDLIDIKGIKIYGTPWQPKFNDWAFNIEDNYKRRKKFTLIPENIDILITHCPPFGFLDKINFRSNEHLGDKELLNVIKQKLIYMKKHVFGHIHGGYGEKYRYINCSICNEQYLLINEPIVFDI